MSDLTPLEQEVAELIVSALNLEDVQPSDISAGMPLFNEGLGLDSIDALELSLSITAKYGFKITSDDTNIFSNVRVLSEHVEANRKS